MTPETMRPATGSNDAASSDGEARLSIHGMTCAGCVSTVEGALKRVPGVADATVNLATEEARVRFAPGGAGGGGDPEGRGNGPGVPMGALIAAVESAGYRAAPRAAAGSGEREAMRLAEERANRRRLLLAVAC